MTTLSATVNPRQEQLDRLYRHLFGDKQEAPPHEERNGHSDRAHTNGECPAGAFTDDEVIELAQHFNGDKFGPLMAGNMSGYNNDESRADQALLSIIVYYTRDVSQIEKIFDRSKLSSRGKWQSRGDYRTMSIKSALEFVTKRYTGPTLAVLLKRQEEKEKRKEKRKSKTPRQPASPGEMPSGFFALTDTGNAQRLTHHHGADLRFCHPWKEWMTWDGRRWVVDDTGEITRRAIATVRTIYAEAQRAEKPEDRLTIARWAESSECAKLVRAMIDLARSFDGIPVLPKHMDIDPWLFNAQNGTVDLRTGRLREHRREDLLTKISPVEFDYLATCPRWIKFLDRIMAGNQNLIDYLQRVVGYCLTGKVNAQCLWFLYGTGANGKSTFLDAVLEMVGDYGIQAVSDLLMAKKNESHPAERADLFGKRVAATIETEEGKRLAEALMKQLTGGDKIRARQLYQKFFEFKPTHKILLAANHKPTVRGVDFAVWRRIKMVPFTVTIGDAEKDPDLPDKLRAEMPGILAWAVRGCLDWQRNGMKEPEEVKAATEAYKNEQDLIAKFISECCFVHSAAKVRVSVLHEMFVEWSGDRSTGEKDFNASIRLRGFTAAKGTKGWYFWQGIGLPS